jgi:hypothetical protein
MLRTITKIYPKIVGFSNLVRLNSGQTNKIEEKTKEMVGLTREEYQQFQELVKANELKKQEEETKKLAIKNYKFSGDYWATACMGAISNGVLCVLMTVPYNNHQFIPIITGITGLGILGSFYPNLKIQAIALGFPVLVVIGGFWTMLIMDN